jgi:penicillin amidase
VVRERFDADTAAAVAGGANGLSAALLRNDEVGWFRTRSREEAIIEAMRSAIDWLAGRLGEDVAEWKWGRLHVLPLRHVLSGRGDLGRLLDHGGQPVKGNMHTVCNTGLGPNFEARTGANYRHVADLADVPAGLWAVDSQSQSGHPGSPHYADQFDDWLQGRYHFLKLDRDRTAHGIVATTTLEPDAAGGSR